ncbi:hypothetical protein BN2127_JRS7_03753 [Bacillus subtilis]|nr:hypothetical protein CE489_17050 [Bacillus spizizenii]CUB31116.1 hypothetical protein BN2127_JRS1_09371 [Bacillus cereus]CUB44805.1 hypothetical protein BN2127_JRS7_03753 [Bacillus subtilis]
MNIRKPLLYCSIILFLIFILMIVASIMSDSNKINYNSFLVLSLSTFALALYLFPELKDNDERSKEIKKRSLFWTALLSLASITCILLLIKLAPILIEPTNILMLIISSIIFIYSFSLIIISKKL